MTADEICALSLAEVAGRIASPWAQCSQWSRALTRWPRSLTRAEAPLHWVSVRVPLRLVSRLRMRACAWLQASWAGRARSCASRRRAMADSYPSSRDFDYGVDDDVRYAVEQVRAEIAASIRHAARRGSTATGQDQFAYEIAARIAESVPEH